MAVIGAADGTSISTEKDDDDQRAGPINIQTDALIITAPVFWLDAAALRDVWEQLGLPLTVGKERSAA
jgi:hypothetical protein